MKFTGKTEIVKAVQEALGFKEDEIDGIDGPDTWNAILNDQGIDEGDLEDDTPSDYPEEFHKSPNQSGLIRPKFIVLHHSSGSHDGTKSWILQSESRVSYHWLIDEDGSRTQFVKNNLKAWHAGKSYWKGYSSLNSHSVSVSFWGDTNKRTPNTLEIDSCAKLCIRLMDELGLGIDDIITHADIAPNRKNDTSDQTIKMVKDRIRELL